MDPTLFTGAHRDVHSARHGKGVVYVGRDVADRWWMLWNSETVILECRSGEANLEKAKIEAHTTIDGGSQCNMKLDWRRHS